jgi:hypothetical protein
MRIRINIVIQQRAVQVKALEDLARRELKVLDHAHRAVGEIGERSAQLRSAGVFAESAAVHAAYADLAAPPIGSLEALKRAVFLGWYESAEPGSFTGVGDLPVAIHRRVHVLLDSAWAAGRIDTEFNVMLGWYWYLASYHFEAHSPKRLAAFLSSLEPLAYKGYDFRGLEGRGQMGRYWDSVRRHAA